MENDSSNGEHDLEDQLYALAKTPEEVDLITHALTAAWKDGYEFRMKETELNKGASF